MTQQPIEPQAEPQIETHQENLNQDVQKTKTSSKKVNKTVLYTSVSLIVLILTLSISSVFLFNKKEKKETNSIANISAKITEDNFNKSEVVSISTSKAPVTIETLAQNRIEDITGLKYSKYQEVLDKDITQNGAVAINGAPAQSNKAKTIAQGTGLLDISKDINEYSISKLSDVELSEKIAINAENEANYTETLYTINDNEYLGYVYDYNNVDTKKPFTVKSWTNGNYTQTIYEQDGKMASAIITTPNSYTTYQGGKYAINVTYDKEIYQGYYGWWGQNTELEFLNNLIKKNKGVIKVGAEKVNEIDCDVYEFNSYTTSSEEKIAEYSDLKVKGSGQRYYVSKDNLALVKTEEIYEGKVILTQLYQVSKKLLGYDVKEAVDGRIFKDANIEIKQVKNYDYTGQPTFKEMLDRGYKFPINEFIPESQYTDFLNGGFYFSFNDTSSDYYKAFYSDDFNGDIVKAVSNKYTTPDAEYSSFLTAGSYAGVRTSIYNKIPDSFYEINYSKEGLNLRKTTGKIKIDNKLYDCEAVYIRNSSNETIALDDKTIYPYTTVDCTVKYDNKFYVFSFYNTGYGIGNSEFNLNNKSTEFYLNIDTAKKDYDDSVTYSEYKELANIEQKDRVLLGDLTDFADLPLSSVTKYRVNNGDKSIKLYNGTYQVYNSIISKYNALEYFYTKPYDYSISSSEAQSYLGLRYAYINESYNKVLETFKGNVNPQMSLSQKIINNVNYDIINLIQSNSEIPDQYVLVNIDGKVGIINLYSDINDKSGNAESYLIKALNKAKDAKIDKDIDKLKKQVEDENNRY